MLKLLATTENSRKSQTEYSSCNRGKLLENTRVKLLFAILPESCDTSRANLFPIQKSRVQKERQRRTINWTRVILEWKGGQLKLPNCPGVKNLLS